MFKHLIYHDLIEVIDLRNCAINYKIFQYLTQHFPRLTTLHLGQTENKLSPNPTVNEFFPTRTIDKNYFLKKSTLKILSIEGVCTTPNDTIEDIFYQSLTQSSEHLRLLDLSRNMTLESLSYIDCFKQIYSLILYDISPIIIESALDCLCQLKTLVVLDLSLNRRNQETLVYSKPTITLAQIIRALPKLLSLDISGTNLAGSFSFVEEEELAYIRKELSINDDE